MRRLLIERRRRVDPQKHAGTAESGCSHIDPSPADHSGERGVTIALVAVAMVGIIAMAGLSIDIGTLYEASAEAQRAADAGALAAARFISMSGVTGDTSFHIPFWSAVCGGNTSPASTAAITVAQSNTVGGNTIPAPRVTYGGPSVQDCSAQPASFAINPTVTVVVQQTNLPVYFSRIWGSSGRTVSATATAEVFNPSNSVGPAGGVVPVQPRCVKPWIVPNSDPGNPGKPFVSPTDGSIQNPGISVNGSAAGVIGEQFVLYPDCYQGAGVCNFGLPFTLTPTSSIGFLPYLPGLAPASSVAVPSCGKANTYQEAIAGCDETTAYQCGVAYASASTPNQLDLNENPSGNSGDTSTAVQCLIHQAGGHDLIDTTVYPFQIQAGSGNPLGVAGSTPITSSSSIVSLPIYDTTSAIQSGVQQPSVTIVGFLQVFIQNVQAGGTQTTAGTLLVTVLNVAGCGDLVPAGNQPIYGSSPVPVRLITSP